MPFELSKKFSHKNLIGVQNMTLTGSGGTNSGKRETANRIAKTISPSIPIQRRSRWLCVLRICFTSFQGVDSFVNKDGVHGRCIRQRSCWDALRKVPFLPFAQCKSSL